MAQTALLSGFLLANVLLYAQAGDLLLDRAASMARAGRIVEALELLRSASSNPNLSARYFHLLGTLEAQANQTEKAESDLEMALSMAPDSADAMYTLGLVRLQLQKPDQARAVLSRSIQLNGRRPESWLALGDADLRLKEDKAAQRAFRTAVSLAPDVATVHMAIGIAYQGQGRHREAIPAFEKAVSLAKDDAAPRIALVRALLQAGQGDRALQRVEEWRKQKTGTPFLHTELGIALAEWRFYQEAIREFQAVLESDPSLVDVRYNQALAYYYDRLYSESEQILKVLVAQGSASDQVHHLLGLIYEGTSKTAAAQEFEKAARLSPRTEDYQYHLGRIALEAGQYGEAERHFLAGIELCGAQGCRKSLLGLGAACKLQGKSVEAVRAFERVIEQEPQDVEGYLYLGDALIRANNFGGARRALKRALELKPDSSLGHYMYAYSILKGESPNNSLASHHLEEALRLDPASPLPYYRLGMLNNQAGQYTAAVELLEKAVALSPELRGARYQLGLAYGKLGKRDLAEREFERLRASTVKAMEEEAEMMTQSLRLPADEMPAAYRRR